MILTPNEMPLPRSIINRAAKRAWSTTFCRLAVDDAFSFVKYSKPADEFDHVKENASCAWHIAADIMVTGIEPKAKVYALRLKEPDDV